VVGGSDKRRIEVGIIGREGMTGLMSVLGNDRSPFETFCQIPGDAMVIGASELQKVLVKSSTFTRYVQVFMIQTAQTAVANATSLLPQRLARWLVMCEDRLGTKQIPLTHEFLSIMLGAQRTGVTVAIAELESRSLIHAKRGLISILDRDGLIELTNGVYGVAELEYKRRLGIG
jgi:CRP-like cAMP-binding protein